MLASDDANTNFTGARDPDAALAVEFYIRPVQNMFKSTKEGHPIFEDVTYVRINIPGMKESQIDTPARSDHQARFPRQWQHFVNRTQGDAREVGMPLSEWPLLTRSQAEELQVSPELLATAGLASEGVCLWQIAEERCKTRLPVRDGQIRALSVHAASQRLALATSTGLVGPSPQKMKTILG